MKKLYVYCLCALGMMFLASSADAAGLTDYLDRGTSLLQSGGKFLFNLYFIIGIFLLGVCLFTFKSLGNPQQEKGKAITAVLSFIVGSALVGFKIYVVASATTVSGSDDSSSAVEKSNYGF
jgi:uncharacterized membrane protein YedE/YeeE